MNIFIMSRQSPGPARPGPARSHWVTAHTRPRPGPSPMCLNCFQPRPGPGPQYVGPGPARPARLCRGPARSGPRAAGRAGLGPKARPAQGTSTPYTMMLRQMFPKPALCARLNVFHKMLHQAKCNSIRC